LARFCGGRRILQRGTSGADAVRRRCADFVAALDTLESTAQNDAYHRQQVTKALNDLVNRGSLRCFEHAGWQVDCVQHEYRLYARCPVDTVIMAITNDGEWTYTPPTRLDR
jgi:hypothetical protein